MIRKYALSFIAAAFLSVISMPAHAWDPLGSSLLNDTMNIFVIEKKKVAKKSNSHSAYPRGIWLVLG
jgi:hypothetical protein